jgi:hypothetical protein
MYSIVIDHEGYVIKQIADFRCLAGGAKIKPDSLTAKTVSYLENFFLMALKSQRFVLIYLTAEHAALKPRYIKRKSSIEPQGYVAFQNSVFDELLPVLWGSTCGTVIKIDTNQSVVHVHQAIVSRISSVEN